MSKRTRKQIYLFMRYLSRIGIVSGFLLYVKVHVLGSLKNVKFHMMKHPVSLRAGTSDLTTFDQVFVSRQYDLYLGLVPKIIIDCGANVGMASVYFANKFPGAKIIAVEPEKTNFDVMVENCKPYTNIIPVNMAIWNKTCTLHILDRDMGNYAFVTRENGPVDGEKYLGSIEAITVNDLMAKFNFATVDLLKIDIEGAEFEVFADGYEKWLPRTGVAIVEIHENLRPRASLMFARAVSQYDFFIGSAPEGFICRRNDVTS